MSASGPEMRTKRERDLARFGKTRRVRFGRNSVVMVNASAPN